jgi:HEAT repeat protein
LAALEDADAETRIYALWALGAIGDPQALAPLTARLADSDPGLRKTAAIALGELGLPEALPALRRALDDPIADVRWNGALALARLGSDAGVGVLREMLDRGQVALVPGITPEQQEDAMVEAVKALAAVGGADAEALLTRLADGDPSLKVRQAALEASRARAGAPRS